MHEQHITSCHADSFPFNRQTRNTATFSFLYHHDPSHRNNNKNMTNLSKKKWWENEQTKIAPVLLVLWFEKAPGPLRSCCLERLWDLARSHKVDAWESTNPSKLPVQLSACWFIKIWRVSAICLHQLSLHTIPRWTLSSETMRRDTQFCS